MPCPGDILLLMSDGLMELFNEDRELLGIESIEQVLRVNADRSSNEIMNELKNLAHQWAGPQNNEDDITIMIIKIR
jgi:serine phosphatase RsbU (regulator of sigma subunit)